MKFIHGEDLQIYFGAADVCVLPYRQVTTSGAALLAFSFGKPIIAPALGPFPSLVDQARGILYQPGEKGLLGAVLDTRALDLDEARDLRACLCRRSRLDDDRGSACRPLSLPDCWLLTPFGFSHSMLAGHNIVCFSPNAWDTMWRNRQQIMSRLAKQNRVLFVEPTPYLRDSLTILRLQTQRPAYRPRLVSPLPNLWVYTPPGYAPRSGRWPLNSLMLALRQRNLQRVLTRLAITDPLLWVFHYSQGEMIGRLGERLSIYHAVDEYSAYELEYSDHLGKDRQKRIQTREAAIIRQVDLVFVTSPALLESKSRLHPHVVMIPNGVDYDLFSRPPNTDPPELAALPRPWIGFIGVVNEKIDLALLNTLAANHPEWSLVIVGPITLRRDQEQLAALRRQSNVHFIDRQPVERLPAFMAACDVCLMPYKRNEWTRNISPLKLYEYLAVGVPTVSTDIPATRDFADTIWVASDPDSFANAISQALATDSPERWRRQQAIARPHSWDNRIAAFSVAISERLAATDGRATQAMTTSSSYLHILARRWWLLLLLPLVTVGVILLLTTLTRPVYKASVRLQALLVDPQEVPSVLAQRGSRPPPNNRSSPSRTSSPV